MRQTRSRTKAQNLPADVPELEVNTMDLNWLWKIIVCIVLEQFSLRSVAIILVCIY